MMPVVTPGLEFFLKSKSFLKTEGLFAINSSRLFTSV
jgi:hypothetical protein